MADTTGINYGVIETECGNLTKYSKEYGRIASDVKRIHNVLKDWDGDDAKEALQVINKVSKEIGDIEESIFNISKWGKQVAGNYREAESAGKKAYSSFM